MSLHLHVWSAILISVEILKVSESLWKCLKVPESAWKCLKVPESPRKFYLINMFDCVCRTFGNRDAPPVLFACLTSRHLSGFSTDSWRVSPISSGNPFCTLVFDILHRPSWRFMRTWSASFGSMRHFDSWIIWLVLSLSLSLSLLKI